MADIARPVRAHAGTAGGEAQQADIRQLLKELELKKAKLNELKTEARRAEEAIGRARDDATDAQRLTPDGCLAENAYIQVRTHMHAHAHVRASVRTCMCMCACCC